MPMIEQTVVKKMRWRIVLADCFQTCIVTEDTQQDDNRIVQI